VKCQVVANILSSGDKLREYAKGVENNLRKVELDSIEVVILYLCYIVALVVFYFLCTSVYKFGNFFDIVSN
jgi:hypothetical protein